MEAVPGDHAITRYRTVSFEERNFREPVGGSPDAGAHLPHSTGGHREIGPDALHQKPFGPLDQSIDLTVRGEVATLGGKLFGRFGVLG